MLGKLTAQRIKIQKGNIRAKKADKEKKVSGTASEKQKALETALTQIRKECGEESIRRLGDSPDLQVSAVSTGSLTLDLAL